jgi:malonyl-CoA O-methyltransferase
MKVLAPREAYRRLAGDYDSSPNALIALEQRIMTPLLPVNLDRHIVVDVAAGTGRWAFRCGQRGARVIAVDFCHEMLRKASRPPIQIERAQADAELLPLPDSSADVVICAFALGYAPTCFIELARITRPGGMLLVSDVHPDALDRGWTRSFRHRGEAIQVRDQPYELADLYAPGLQLSCLIEPRLGPLEREFFESAGCVGRFEEACREPAIFVARWIRK